MKVGITRNMIVASDTGGTVSFKRGSEVDVSPGVFGRLERAGAAVSLEKLTEPEERNVVANVAESAVDAEPEERADPAEEETTEEPAKPKRKR